MTKIRIWDYGAVARKKSPKYDRVPDTAARPGETNAEWRLRLLLRDLQALAADADNLVAAYDPRVPIADDLANDFDSHVELASRCVEEGLVTAEAMGSVRAVLRKLSEMSDLDDPTLWTERALRSRQEWVAVRQLARKALGVLGYELEPPPPRSM